MKTGRKAKKVIGERFGDCIAIEEAGYKGNNRQANCRCICGEIFKTSIQQLRSKLITACPACRKRKIRESREVERRKRIGKASKPSVKYVLMNSARTQIERGSLGIHAYFDKKKARIAAKLSGSVVVPLSEAELIIACRL